MNRLTKATTVPEREAAEKAYEMFVRYEQAAVKAQQPQTESPMLPSELLRSATEEEFVPPGVLPGVATQDGVASPDLATQEAGAPLIAPTDNSNQEAASAPVLAAQGLTDSDYPNPTGPSTTPVSLEIPEANLETLLSTEVPMEVQQASRKWLATSDSNEQTTDAPTAPPAVEEDGFTVPNWRHTTKPKRLENVLPPPPAIRGKAAKIVQPGVSFASIARGRAAEQQALPRSDCRPPTRNLQLPTNPQPEPSAAGLPPPPSPTRTKNGQAAPTAQSPVAKQCQPSTDPAPPAPAARAHGHHAPNKHNHSQDHSFHPSLHDDKSIRTLPQPHRRKRQAQTRTHQHLAAAPSERH
ncbi:nascent polypeptide-associated complex subunit alpha, muscle-specific form-like [Schistocerca serialis cubense]|uniref:nascent polypeptide-associated complex subunit alpha, muscle-specific form-like n=1 Tax=Schistocerca serialis cubense TaxID=2023355 RepID=UPI00214F467C|nr:nascent polypeptide-associated complex subunit alpha, muscle-specific form-like [Schistocerca serialis cubense]